MYKIASEPLLTPRSLGSKIHTFSEKIIENINERPKKLINIFSMARVLAFLDRTNDSEYIIKIIKINMNFPIIDIEFK